MNLNNLMMLSLFSILSFIYLTKASTALKDSPTLKLSVIVQKDNKSYPLDDRQAYNFSDGEQTTMTCNLKCNGSKCYERRKYSLHLYVHKDQDKNTTVNFEAETTASISRTYTLHKNDTEVVCKAKYHGHETMHLRVPKPAVVRLRYTHAAPGGEGKLLKPSPVQISPGYFKDTGKSFALFTCTVQREGPEVLAFLSWQQMKGSDRIILKTVMPHNHRDGVIHDTLNKTLAESDRDTKLFCAVRYILEGSSLSNITRSNIIVLTFNRTIESFPQERVLGFTQWMAIIGAIIVAALIVVTILIAVILKYKRKVKVYERDEEMRNRPALMPPSENVYELKEYGRHEEIRNRPAEIQPTENVYDQVYGHGAGLKRPRIRPTQKRH